MTKPSRMTLSRRSSLTLLAFGGAGVLTRGGEAADKAYRPGVTDTEIKIGQTAPYSGPAWAGGGHRAKHHGLLQDGK